MSSGKLQIGSQRFRVIPEAEYRLLRAALKRQQQEDAADTAEARKRLKDPKRKTVSLARLKADLGL